ncbi:hypothetical protein FHX15_001801 [Rhizobium sp. BK650]|nr:hypothetical protein [Rhizobium sp. BK650]
MQGAHHLKAARASLATLTLVAAGLMSYDLMPVSP